MKQYKQSSYLEPIWTSGLPKHPPTQPHTKHDQRIARREFADEHRRHTRNVLGSISLAAVTGFSILSNGLIQDMAQSIDEGKRLIAGSHAEIHEIYDYADNDPVFGTHGTFVLTGLGTKDPSKTAELLHAHRDVGDVYALEYSNKDLDAVDMAKRVIKQSKKNNLKEISFDGYSAGGAIALDLAAYIHRHEPNLQVMSVTLNSSPIGEGSLTDSSARGVALMNKILSIYPDFKYYSDGRMLVEVINRSERYLKPVDGVATRVPVIVARNRFSYGGKLYEVDYSKLLHEVGEVEQKMQDPDVASASLIKSQSDFITMTDYDANIRTLSRRGANKSSVALPLIIYTRSRDANDDTVVDVEASERNIATSAARHNTVYGAFHENVGHANPSERRKEYQEMTRKKINPRVAGRLIMQLFVSDTKLSSDGVRSFDFILPHPS